MIRLLTAAAVTILLATPVMAQSVSPSERTDPSLQNQGTATSPSAPPSGSITPSPGLSGQAPADCLPNDPRPACQTAQLPGQEPGSSTITPQPERSSPGSMGSQEQPASPSAPGSMGR